MALHRYSGTRRKNRHRRPVGGDSLGQCVFAVIQPFAASVQRVCEDFLPLQDKPLPFTHGMVRNFTSVG